MDIPPLNDISKKPEVSAQSAEKKAAEPPKIVEPVKPVEAKKEELIKVEKVPAEGPEVSKPSVE